MAPDKEPKVTEFIPEIIKYIEKLIKNDFAYLTDSGIYYDISKYDDYLNLSGRTKEDVLSGSRISLEEDKKPQKTLRYGNFLRKTNLLGIPVGRGKTWLAYRVLFDDKFNFWEEH